RSDPFGAHCWVQHGEAVLNDTAEEVLRYTPILVV
ncbi:MAG TPA: lasso peptide biosynthesis B2 protein, partial [Erythrobacter sp.]|nr:lasso peptide biosynthesis B2 protein [Erythrobacter sp.]